MDEVRDALAVASMELIMDAEGTPDPSDPIAVADLARRAYEAADLAMQRAARRPRTGAS